jgi:hypothetical protein
MQQLQKDMINKREKALQREGTFPNDFFQGNERM